MNDTYKPNPIRINLVQETSVFIYFIPSSTASASPLKTYERALEKFRIISMIISYASISA